MAVSMAASPTVPSVVLFMLLFFGIALPVRSALAQEPAPMAETATSEDSVAARVPEDPSSSGQLPQTQGKRYWEASATRMSEVLTRLGNYTCIVHLSRFERSRRSPLFRKVDSLRLQVTSLDGVEYYSLPGGTRTVKNPREVISTGLVATGIFQGYARAIFLERGLSKLEFLGADESVEAHPLRFKFLFHPKDHPLDIRIGTQRALVPAKGLFWADQKDLRVRRIVVENAEPIRPMRIRRTLYVMDWAPVKTPAGEFLLPQRSEMSMAMEDGSVSRNEATMAQCREYLAESSIRFDGEEDAVENPAASPAEEPAPLLDASSLPASVETANTVDGAVTVDGVEVSASTFLPANLRVTMRLRSSLQLSDLSVGDEFRGSVTRAVLHAGKLLLPEGTEVLGRVRRLSTYSDPSPHAVAWLEISTLRNGATEYTFLGELVRRGNLPGLLDKLPEAEKQAATKPGTNPVYADFGDPEAAMQAVPGVAALLFENGLGTLPAGFEMEWKTIPATP